MSDGLLPFLMSNLYKSGKIEDCENEKIFDCVECGCCSYICPSSIPLLNNIRDGKTKLNLIIKQRKKTD